MKNKLFLVLFITLSSVLFAQEFQREIALRNPAMYGDDIKELQSLLIESGFYQIGEIDGYYNYIMANSIKTIQILWDYEPTGIVNKSLWDELFDPENAGRLSLFGLLSRQNLDLLD